jgi:transposase-like protein
MVKETRDAGISGGPKPSGGSRSEPEQGAGPPERDAENGTNEVLAHPKRRKFTSEYKLRIVREAEKCRGASAIGELLRREGLYSSHLVNWRKLAEQGQLDGLTRKRGRKGKKADPGAKEMEKLRRENERLKADLEEARILLDFQKKVAGMLGVRLNRPPNADDGS